VTGRLSSMPTAARVVRRTLSEHRKLSSWALTLTLRVSTAIVSLANVVVIARFLGPAESGRYFLFVSAVLVLAVIAELGLSQSAAVFPAIYPRSVGAIHATLIKYILRLSGLTLVGGLVVIAIIGNRVLPSIPARWMIVAVAAVPLTVYANVWNNLAIGLGRVVSGGLVQVGAMALTLALDALYLGVLHGRALSAIVLYTVVLTIQAIAMWLVIWRLHGRGSATAPQMGLGSEMVRFGIRGYAGAMSSFLWMRATIFLLDAFHGPAAVGLFAIAQQLAERTLLPAQVVKDVMYRDVAAAEHDAATEATNSALRIVILALVPLTGVVALLAPTFVHVLFGAKYDGSAPVFRILFIGTACMVVPTLLVPYFLGQLRRPGLLSLLAWINVGINTVLALLLVPRGAELGAAVALVGTQVIGTAIALSVYIKCSRTSMVRALMPRYGDFLDVKRTLMALARVNDIDS
jgi:O-antigen/teichoic acid export membrane protein